MRLFLLFCFWISLFLLSSCKKYQAADPSFFIQSNKVSVATNPSEGSGSAKITDLWIYVNGKYQGTYPVGHLMPIISKDQSVEINVFAGIKNNGIAKTRIFYPFYEFLTFDTLVPSGKTIQRDFTFKYKAATTFTWTENFDNLVGRSVEKDVQFGGTVDTAPAEDSFENKSLRISLPPGEIKARVLSSGSGFELPAASSNVYLELDYKCDTEFSIGLMSASSGEQSPAIALNPSENWNKIYIQLSSAVNAIDASKYKVYFEFIKDASSGSTTHVYLDNIKLLFF